MPLPPSPHPFIANAERLRMVADREGREPWRKWGPYLSERQWGTVREDYSPTGDAWDFFPYEHSHARAYRWGEDGLAGFCDDEQRLCLGLALWNGRDDTLKERLFGLNNAEGNHGEDVKELYYYLDATPSQSYLKFLYKYPQGPFPYAKLLEEGHKRGTGDPIYLYYTLGKLQILKLREDYKKMKGSAYTLQEFHDSFLKQGFPPIRLLRRALLGEEGTVL